MLHEDIFCTFWNDKINEAITSFKTCQCFKIGFTDLNPFGGHVITGVIPISLFLLATGTVLRKAAIDRGVRLATGRYGCRQINKPSNSTVSVLI